MTPDALIAVERCPHRNLDYFGTQYEINGDSFELYTCQDCGGMFSEQSLEAMRSAHRKHLFVALAVAICAVAGGAIILAAAIVQHYGG